VLLPAGAVMELFLSDTASRPALGPTHLPVQWVLGALTRGVKRPGHQSNHSPPTSAEVKNACSHISTPLIRLHGAVLN
jgi:hypothetical protein